MAADGRVTVLGIEQRDGVLYGRVLVVAQGFHDSADEFGPWYQEAEIAGPLGLALYDWTLERWRDAPEGNWRVPAESERPLTADWLRNKVKLALVEFLQRLADEGRDKAGRL